MGRKKKDEEVMEDSMEETVEQEDTNTATDTRSKRDIIAEAIEAGGATMESLMEAADCKYASVMSNFSMLRLMGKCAVKDVETEFPVLDAEGNEQIDDAGEVIMETILTYRLVDAAEWEEIKAAKAANAKTKKAPARTPEETLEVLQKRVAKATKTVEGVVERANKDEESQILQLRAEKANIELQIAELELADHEAKMAE